MQKKHENRIELRCSNPNIELTCSNPNIELTCSNPNIFETYFCRPLDISYSEFSK